ncbi:MAG: flagellar basal body-associated FliL family protein [Kofleriaceae bacterium]
MSDEAPKPEAAPKGPKGPKVMVALLVLNLAATGFTTFKVATATPAAPHGEVAPVHPVTTEVVGPVIALDPFVVNLDEPGQSRYLKLTLQFELINAEAETAITKNKNLIRDSILSHMSSLHLAETLGAAAKDKLRSDIMAKLETMLGPNKVRRIFFQEFVVQ